MSEKVFEVFRIPIEQVDGNSYIIARGDEGMVIDTGTPGNAQMILKAASSMNIKISSVIITHYHLDHTGSLKDLKKSTGAKVFVHELDAPFVSGKEKPPIPSTAPQEAKQAYSWYSPVEPDVILKDGDSIFGFRVIHVPGHTPGSIALYDGRFLFAGDNLNFRDGRIQGTPAIFDWKQELARESLKKLVLLDFDILLPGHGKPVLNSASEQVRKSLESQL
jgi:glyoxylase-like metal-dependent hydrolase (beta-lactamase superfamily II)